MVIRHGARTALLPIVTVIGLSLGALLSGAVLTETIFNLTGIGKTILDAVNGRDYIMIQGITLLIAIVFVVVNLLVDISYASSTHGSASRDDDRRASAGSSRGRTPHRA